MDVDTLNQRIADGSPDLPELLMRAPVVGVDRHNRSPFDVALASNRVEAIEALAAREETHAFAAVPDADRLHALKQTVAMLAPIRDPAAVEAQLRNTFGADLGLGRSPLLQACRLGNEFAMGCLLAAGAKPGGKDLLGLSDAELCLASGGVSLLERYVELCAQHGRRLVLAESPLEALLDQPEVLGRLAAQAGLSTGARRLLLCLHCARLDLDAVSALLEGQDPNKLLHRDANPVFEACTSHRLWAHALPEWLPLAWAYARSHGAPGAHAIRIDPNAAGGAAAQMRQAREQQREKQAALDAFRLQPDALAVQLERRLQLIDLLLEAGLDPAQAGRKAPDFFVRDLLALKQPGLIAGLLQRGFELNPKDYEREQIPRTQRILLDDLRGNARRPPEEPGDAFLALRESEARWELPGETSVLAGTLPSPPTAGQACLARVTVHNLYGPIADCRVALRLGGADETAWQPMRPVEELIEADGELRRREPGEDEPLGEAPWSITFDLELDSPPDTGRIELRLDCAAPDLCLDLPDWELRP